MDISDVLDMQGYSIYFRNLYRSTHLITQYLEYQCTGVKAITSGGMGESSNMPGSDVDIMEVVNGFKVIEQNTSKAHSTGTTEFQKWIPLYICRRCCKAGYCRLEVTKIYYQEAVYCCNSPSGKYSICEIILDITKKQNDRYFISSKLFQDKVIPEEYVFPNDDVYELRRNGPAVTCENLDRVKSLELKHWPPEAIAWKSRERQNNWPSNELLSFLERNVSCYVVPVGCKSSKRSDLEWRISFVEIERYLIWNMNDTQFKCFILLKMLKKEYMKCEISTYHIKNVAFWSCEDLPERSWRKDLLFICVKNGLLKLRQYVEKGFLPHYVVPDNNLFFSKNIIKPEEKKYTLNIIDEINNDLEDKLSRLLLTTDLTEIHYSVSMVREYWRRCTLVLLYVRLTNSQSLCDNMGKKFGQDGEDILPCIRLALTKLELRKCSGTVNEIDDFIRKMKKESVIDYLTVALTCGMVYFVNNRYSDVRNALTEKLKDGSYKCYIKDEGDFSYMSLMSGDIIPFKTNSCKQVKDIRTDRQNLVMDFVVNYHELEYVPFPLKLQLTLCGPGRFIACNPLVLSCYMLYISEYNLDLAEEMEKTRAVFENVLSKVPHPNIHYIHLNMLGHSLYVTGDSKSAFKYFVLSLRTFQSYKNGGVYHIACMINDILQNKCPSVES
ncbi:uncharacterized protein LOC123529992 [Mercenaria mercenaria]|uniref:uncharacterized protein LOC123529992 n=1 Tax=Mercenaria mercenaria TaxID=6596 RepID=UPI00234F9D2A|nr:uncharacterized protein LOC123529992 [Mercenaria mercenaria]